MCVGCGGGWVSGWVGARVRAFVSVCACEHILGVRGFLEQALFFYQLRPGDEM